MRPPNDTVIGHFVSNLALSSGGVAQAVLELCSTFAIANPDNSLRLICKAIDRDFCKQVLGIDNIQILQTSAIRFPSVEACNLLVDCDVVHLHGPWEPINCSIARALAKRGQPYVVSVHGMLDRWSIQQKKLKKLIFLRTLGRRLFVDAARVHLTAAAELEQAAEVVPIIRYKSDVIPCIVDLQPYRHIPNGELAAQKFQLDHRPAILFISRIHPKKGLEILIDACAELRRAGKEFQLLIAGPGEANYIRQLETRTQQAGLSVQTRFLGSVSGELKSSLYAFARVLALPTHQENFGLVLAESLLCQTPVITTRNTDIWQELEAAQAVIVPTNTVQDFSRGLEPFLNDAIWAKSLGVAGRVFVQKWLAQEKLSEAYRTMYLSAIRGLPAAS